MTREEIIESVSEKMRLIRTEAGYTQDKMAEVIGLSKKTLVQIEKGRLYAGWSTVVAVCALFRETETVRFLFGNEPLEVLETVARDGMDYRKEKTLGGKVWWREVEKRTDLFCSRISLVSIFVLLTKIISGFFLALTKKNQRIVLMNF